MPFCPECGKSVAPHAKFCRNCGASQLEDVPTIPVPASVQTAVPSPAPVVIPPSPPPVMARPADQLLCSSCGSPLAPSEKFCGICGARAGVSAPATPVPLPVVPAYVPEPVRAAIPPPPPVPSPAPVMGQNPGVRTCNSCGNIIRPGDKYCSKCLAIVRDNPPQAAIPVPPPMQPSHAAAPGSYVCASCGSPVIGAEKFCGICGAPVVGACVPAPAQSQPVQKTCSACGAPVSDTTKFCGGCGAPVGASFRPGEVVPPFPVPAASPVPAPGMPVTEEVIGVIANARKMKLFGASWDSYNIIVTRRRMILVQMTAAMLNVAVMEAQQQAKAEGKGFFAIAKDQMAASFQFPLRYETMPPELALSETPGNFALENARISAIHLNLQGGDSDDGSSREFKIYIESLDGKFEYVIAENERFINILKEAYTDRVHMPFGYFNIGGARLKIF